MLIAATLSRAHLPDINASVFVREFEEVDHKANLPVSDARWEQAIHASANDPVLKRLRGVIQTGWPERKSDVSECLRPYFDLRNELVRSTRCSGFQGCSFCCSHLYAQGTDVCCTLYTHRNRRVFDKSSRVLVLAKNCIRRQRLSQNVTCV